MGIYTESRFLRNVRKEIEKAFKHDKEDGTYLINGKKYFLSFDRNTPTSQDEYGINVNPKDFVHGAPAVKAMILHEVGHANDQKNIDARKEMRDVIKKNGLYNPKDQYMTHDEYEADRFAVDNTGSKNTKKMFKSLYNKNLVKHEIREYLDKRAKEKNPDLAYKKTGPITSLKTKDDKEEFKKAIEARKDFRKEKKDPNSQYSKDFKERENRARKQRENRLRAISAVNRSGINTRKFTK